MAEIRRSFKFKPLLDIYQEGHPLDWDRIFGRRAPLIMEIGFGDGDFLIRTAHDNPGCHVIGIETIWDRIFKALKKINRQKQAAKEADLLDNLKILQLDARLALRFLFKPGSIQRVYCLFPCPWPKTGHSKHRLFSREFLRLLNNRLGLKAQCQIVTDFFPYVEWIESQVTGTGFHFGITKIGPRFETKYERKWRAEGQEDFFAIELKKTRHVRFNSRREYPMKTYTIKHFDPKRFEFIDEKGDCSVIFKEKFFDQEKQTALVELVVAEEHLIQHLWVMIIKKGETWQVGRAEGQRFFPTPGVSRAIHLVAKAAEGTAL